MKEQAMTIALIGILLPIARILREGPLVHPHPRLRLKQQPGKDICVSAVRHWWAA
jgi:hypothetical protein